MPAEKKRRNFKVTTLQRFGCIALLTFPVCSWAAQANSAQAAGTPKMQAAPHTLSSHFFGVNIENSYFTPIPSWTDPKLQRAIRTVGIETIRFPGGDAGNYWDWQSGSLYPRGGNAKVQDSLNNLAALSHATNTYPIYNLNVMTWKNALVDQGSLSSARNSQMQMLQAAGALKLPVQDLELGNEFFWTGSDHNKAFPSAESYASAMNSWTTFLKQRYPSANIAAVASIPSKGDKRTTSWNAAVIGKIKGVDAITLHRYDSIIDSGIWDGTPADAVLSYAFSDWSQIVSGEMTPIEKSRLRVWITEFGGFKDCTKNASLTGTWLEALYQSQMVIQFLSSAAIDQIDLYNMTGSTSSLFFQNTANYWDSCLNKNISFHATWGDLTATGQAFSLIGATLKKAQSVYPITLPEAPMIHPKSGGTPYPSATGVAFLGEERQWLITNFAAKPLTLHYPGMGTGTIESYNAPSLTTVIASERGLLHAVHPFDGRAFVLPPFSVNRIVAK